MFKLVLEKAKELEIKLPTSAGSWKKQESSRKTSIFCFIDYAKESMYNRLLFSHKKNKIILFVVTGVDLEIIILGEVSHTNII